MLSALILTTAALITTSNEASVPPDIVVEWTESGEPSSAPVEGAPGSTVDVRYRVRNAGGSDAYAVFLQAHTALGPLGPRVRLRPGPRAGRGIDRRLEVPISEGMRELCVEARLQTLDVGDPQDSNPRNNRACRPIRVTEPETSELGRGRLAVGVSQGEAEQ